MKLLRWLVFTWIYLVASPTFACTDCEDQVCTGEAPFRACVCVQNVGRCPPKPATPYCSVGPSRSPDKPACKNCASQLSGDPGKADCLARVQGDHIDNGQCGDQCGSIE